MLFRSPGTYPPKLSPILMAVIKFPLVRWLAKGINKKPVMKTNFLTAVNEGYHHYKPSKRAIQEYYEITHNEQAHKCSISFFSTYKKELPLIQQKLSKLSVPTLITWGKQDPFVLVENAEELSKLIPNNRLVIFDNASHFSSEDAGTAYTDTLINWIERDYKNANAA